MNKKEFQKHLKNKVIIDNNEITAVKTNTGDYNISGLFINIGYEPSLNILNSLNLEIDRNYIVVDKSLFYHQI